MLHLLRVSLCGCSIFLLLIAALPSCSRTSNLSKRNIAFVNDVIFKDKASNKTSVGNAFLVSHRRSTYAVTAKHVLNLAKTSKMDVVDFEDELAYWTLRPKQDTTKSIKLGEFLSTNRSDSLTWDYMYNNWDTYEDWIVFEVEQDVDKTAILSYRDAPLQKGEPLYVVGWSYEDTAGKQRVYQYTYDSTMGNYHSLIQQEGPKSLAGLSGSPVVDKKGLLVGLVTSGGEDETTGKTMLDVTSVDGFRKFIESL